MFGNFLFLSFGNIEMFDKFGFMGFVCKNALNKSIFIGDVSFSIS